MVMVYEGSALKHLAQIRPEYPAELAPRQPRDGLAAANGRSAATPEPTATPPRPATRDLQSGEGSEPTPCGFCGQEFVEDRSQATCQACPLSKACGLMRCPHCGFENAKEPGWLSRIKEWIG